MQLPMRNLVYPVRKISALEMLLPPIGRGRSIGKCART